MVLISFCGSTYRSLKLSPKVHQHTPQIRRPSRGCEGVHTRQGFEMPCESLSSVNSLSLSFPSSTVSLCFFSFVGHRRVFSADFHYVSPVTSYVDPRPRGGVQQIQALMAVARASSKSSPGARLSFRQLVKKIQTRRTRPLAHRSALIGLYVNFSSILGAIQCSVPHRSLTSSSSSFTRIGISKSIISSKSPGQQQGHGA